MVLTIQYSEITLVLLNILSALVSSSTLSFIKNFQVVKWLIQTGTRDCNIQKWILHHVMVVNILGEAHRPWCLCGVESLLLDSISLVSHGCLERGS